MSEKRSSEIHPTWRVDRRRFLTAGATAASTLWLPACDEAGAPASEELDPSECAPMVPTFPAIVDEEDRAGFTRMDQSTQLDWLTIGIATGSLARKLVPDGILDLLRQLDTLWVGYPVSVLAHSLQTATRALRDGAGCDLVLAALCHDIGFALTVEGHAEVSAAILRGYVTEDAYRVVRHHTEFELKHYGALVGQPTDQRNRYAAEPWYADAVRFADAWECVSFDPDYDTLPLEEFELLVREKFGQGELTSEATATDCVEGAR